MRAPDKLLWVDCAAGALAGGTVLPLAGWLSRIEGVPRGVLLSTGAVNLLYASYSFSLAVQARRPLARVRLLALANVAWAPVCLGVAVAVRKQASGFGFAHLVGEAAFVGALGALEWTQRHRLATTP